MSHQDEITFQNNGKIVSEEWVQNAFKNKRQKKDWNKEKFQIKNYEHSKIYNIRILKIQYKSRVYTRR